MPKMKSHRGASKRFKRTASGKLKRAQANKRHILTKKPTKRKRHLRQGAFASPSDQKRLQHMVPKT